MNIIIVEDSEVVRGVLRTLLSQVSGVALTGEFACAGTAIAGVRDSPPDAMLLDIQVNAGNGMDVLQVVSQEC
ncbi:MAG: response regulator transcription factor, partial [Aeromicrobium sp.]|nr:response regulator transcription factor [Burkholderiales bacterium]